MSGTAQLTPFNPPTAAPVHLGEASANYYIPGGSGDYTISFAASMATKIAVGDQIRLQSSTDATAFMVGAVLALSNANRDVEIRVNSIGISG